MRAFAFLLVFLYHYLKLPWGWSGVEVFFVLSGFLITGILFDTRDDRYRVRNFYLRRTLRIFPLYYGTMLILLLLWPVFHWQINWHWLLWPAYLGNLVSVRYLSPGSSRQLLANFQLVGSWQHHAVHLYLGHFWTLCVEEQFYLLWPFLVFVVRDRKRLLWICGLSVPVCVLARLWGLLYLPTWLLDQDVLAHFFLFQLDSLLLGGFLALALRGRHRELLLQWSAWLLPPALVAAFIWAFLLAPRRHMWINYPYPRHTLTLGLTCINLLTGLLVLNVIQPGSWSASVFGLRPLRWLGRLSYGAYVFHDIPHLFYANLVGRAYHPSTRATALLAFVITMLLAWVSFRFYESPFLNLKERLTFRG